MKNKKVIYGYLLNNERKLEDCIPLADGAFMYFSKTIKQAMRKRHNDCYDQKNRAGSIVKITLELVKK